MAKKKLTIEDVLVPKEEIPYEVPENWCWVKLGGLTTVKSSKRILAKEYQESGIPFFRSKEVVRLSSNQYITDNIYITEERYNEIKEKFGVPKVGDLLITCVGTIGETWIVDDRKFYYKDGNLVQIDDNEYINTRYIELVIKSTYFANWVNSTVSGSAYSALTIDKLKQLPIPFPPLDEQGRIVNRIESLFDKVDKASELVDEARDGFEKRRAAILERAFCGELTKKWREDNGVSDEWNKKRLSDICEVIMGQSPKGSSYNDLGEGIPLVNGPVEFGPSHFSRTIKSKWTTQPTKMCKKLDLLLCVRGSTLGRINIAGFEACIGRGVAAIRAKENVDQMYINYKIHAIRNEIYNVGTGTTFPNISSQQIKDIEIKIPSVDEQKVIVCILDKLLGNEENIEGITMINRNIDIIKKSILAKAFRGELGRNNLDENSSIELLETIIDN